MLTVIVTLFVLLLFRVVYTFIIDKKVRALSASHKVIYAIPITTNQIKREKFKPGLGAFIDFVFLTVAYFLGIIHFSNSTIYEFLFLLLSHVFIVEPIYYFFHRLLHVGKLYRNHHLFHHKSTVTAPNTSFTFTVVERFMYTILFSFPLLVTSFFGFLSLPGLFIYVIVFDLLNMIGHTHVEFFPRGFYKSCFRYFIYTPSFHSQHHTKFNKNYSLFMPIFDVIFGTFEPTTVGVFDQVNDCRPLNKLSEKPVAR